MNCNSIEAAKFSDLESVSMCMLVECWWSKSNCSGCPVWKYCDIGLL